MGRRPREVRPLRRGATVALLLAIAAGCSRVPPGGEAGSSASGLTGPQGSAADPSAGLGGSPSRTAALGTTPPSAGATRGISPPLTGAGGPVQGIDPAKRTIKIVFHMKLSSCGPDAATAEEGIASDKGKLAIDEYVKWFNAEVLEPFGWTLVHSLVDDGGPYCPEKARAAGLRITKEIKPFAAIGGSNNLDQGPVLADVVTRSGVVHIGSSWGTFDQLRAHSPYAWVTFGVAQKQLEYLSTFIAKRVRGTRTVEPTTQTGSVDRVWGMVAIDNPEGRALSAYMKTSLQRLGIRLSQVYLLSGDPGVAAQAATTTVQKMRQDGVNTLIWELSTAAQAGIVYTSAMGVQNYAPDLLIGTYGIGFFDRLYDQKTWARARGTSIAGIIALRTAVVVRNGALVSDPRYENLAENTEGYVRVWRERLERNDHPQDGSNPPAYGTFANLATLTSGIMNAGPELDVRSWASGVDVTASAKSGHCAQERFMGRDYTFNPYYDWNMAQEGGLKGYATIYWDPSRRTGLGTNGVYQSYDRYQYFHGVDDLPAAATYDTGRRSPDGPDLPKQKPIGLMPWLTCASFGLSGDTVP